MLARYDAEARIAEKVREIAEILKEYNPESDYFSLGMRIKDDAYFSFNNSYWDDDENKPIKWSEGGSLEGVHRNV